MTAVYGGIIKIIVFGSFISGSFNRASDLDLFLIGLDNKDYYDAKRHLEDIIGIDVDLYNNEGDEFFKKIEKRGIVVYERETGIVDSRFTG